MIGDNSKVALTLDNILQQTKLSRNEICCKLRELNDALGAGTSYMGIEKLTGTASFTTTTAPSVGTTYSSVTMKVVSINTGSVTVTDSAGNAESVGYANLQMTWNASGDLTIATTGDAVVVINYTTI